MCSRFIPKSINRHLFDFSSPDPKDASQNQTRHPINSNWGFLKEIVQKDSERRSSSCPNKPHQKILVFNYKSRDKQYPGHDYIKTLSQVSNLRPSALFRENPIYEGVRVRLEENFYYHLVDFVSDSVIALGLKKKLQLFDFSLPEHPSTQEINIRSTITAVRGHPTTNRVFIGTEKGGLRIWDRPTSKLSAIHRPIPFSGRVGVIETTDQVILAGNRNGFISGFDLRAKQAECFQVRAHTLEICAIRTDPFENNQFATGGNDNLCKLFDLRCLKPFHVIRDHTAAIRAMAWSPYVPGLLVTGGGSGDQNLCLWNTRTKKCLKRENLHSQICNVEFTSDECIVTSHGWPKNNVQLRNPEFVSLNSFKESQNRVLYFAINPSRNKVVSAAADKKVIVWDVRNLLDTKKREELVLEGNFNLTVR